MANVKFRHSSAGYVELMKSSAMNAEVNRRAQAIAARADSMVGGKAGMRNPNFVVVDSSGDRAGASVVPANPHSIAHNAKYNTLQKSVDAGRG